MTVDSVSSAPERVLPTGVVTFLFSDIEGSTKLLNQLGDDYAEVLLTHHRLMRECFAANNGSEVDTEGDAFFVAFSSPRDAVAAAVAAQRSLHGHAWSHGGPVRVRMGLHTGDPLLVDGKYVGIDVHRGSRICSAAHGGQVVISARLGELVGDRLPAGVHLRDLGEHRLKDLARPEHLLQVDIEGLSGDFPALRSLEPETNVPQHAAELVGRRQERSDLKELLARPDVRLVTVTGPGGAGKTRLSAAVALELRDQFPYGVYFVDLTHVRDGPDVLTAIGSVLRVPLEGDQHPAKILAAHIGEERMLLVLDNFEQVVDGALPLSMLLKACPNLRVIATSRILLDLEDEFEYVLPPLGLPRGPSLDEVRISDAAKLFVERACKARHGFRLTLDNAGAVARICTLLDGLPLAIELAAARVKLFTPQKLLARLGGRLQLLTGGARDLPERHRTLRATIDWSYALLTEEERRCFLELSVFHGGARLESIEAVLQPETDVLEPLSALVNHSLVMNREDPDGEPRFLMLQTIRDYACELLSEDQPRRHTLQAAHADHFLQVVEDLMLSATQPERHLIRRDHDNVRAALEFMLAQASTRPGAGDKALRIARAMSTYWYRHGESAEGFGWLERALAAAADPSEDLKADALRMLGVMSESRQDLDRARELLTQARALYQKLGDRSGEARTLNSLAVVDRSAGRPADAELLLRAAVGIREELHDPAGAANSLNNLGILLLDRGAWREAIEVLTDTLERDRAADDDWGVACCTLNLAVAHLVGNQVDRATQQLREALVSFVELGDRDALLETLEAVVGVAAARQDWRAAARLGGASDATRLSLGLPGSPADRAHFEGWVDEARANLSSDEFEAMQAEGRGMSLEHATSYGLRDVLDGAGQDP